MIERASHLPYWADDLSSVHRTARPGWGICLVKQLDNSLGDVLIVSDGVVGPKEGFESWEDARVG
jgi:hypothetical protein